MVFFQKISARHRCFESRVILFHSRHEKRFSRPKLSTLKSVLTVKIPLPRPVVILHPFCWSNSPLPAQRSSSTNSGGQILPSTPSGHFHPFSGSNSPLTAPPSGHPAPILAVKFTPPRPAVILHPFCRSSSPLPAQRSSSTPSFGQIHPSPPSGHFHPFWRPT